MQRIHDPERCSNSFRPRFRPSSARPGTWMHDALELRDQWTSRLLRTSSWSPLF